MKCPICGSTSSIVNSRLKDRYGVQYRYRRHWCNCHPNEHRFTTVESVIGITEASRILSLQRQIAQLQAVVNRLESLRGGSLPASPALS